MMTKVCSQCGEEKILDEFYSWRDRRRKSSTIQVDPYCIECRRRWRNKRNQRKARRSRPAQPKRCSDCGSTGPFKVRTRRHRPVETSTCLECYRRRDAERKRKKAMPERYKTKPRYLEITPELKDRRRRAEGDYRAMERWYRKGCVA